MKYTKVFGLGLSKTGTTALCQALKILGYKTAHFISVEEFSDYNAICDSPVPILYQRLDQMYPNSKFVLTMREQDKWLSSFKKHLKKWQFEKSIELGSAKKDAVLTHFFLYGTLRYDPDKLIAGFNEYHQEVMAYFADRPNDLLIMDITKGDGWEKLCSFLELPIPDVEFPVSNTAENVEAHLQKSNQLHYKIWNYFSWKIKRLKHKILVEMKYLNREKKSKLD